MKDLVYSITTMNFAYASVLLFPFLFWFLLVTRTKRPSEALLYPNTELLQKIPRSLRLRLRAPILYLLLSIFIIALSFAAARPQRSGKTIFPQKSRNIMLALDVSNSMSTADIRAGSGVLSRMQAVKAVVKEFVENRLKDKLGLVVFGSTAYLQAPLTLDRNLVAQLVSQLEVGMAGDGTAIGDGIGVSIKHIEKIAGETKAIILLTDGVSNSGQVNPLKAAKVAADLGIKIHTIGIGSEQTSNSFFPNSIFSQNIGQMAEYDERTLKEVAQISGGVFFNAKDLSSLKNVYAEIDKLEQSEDNQGKKQLFEELFAPFALVAWIAFALYLILAHTIFLKVP